jgi:hypothetical protein
MLCGPERAIEHNREKTRRKPKDMALGSSGHAARGDRPGSTGTVVICLGTDCFTAGISERVQKGRRGQSLFTRSKKHLKVKKASIELLSHRGVTMSTFALHC